MEREGRDTSVNRSEKTFDRASKRATRSPRFDVNSIQRARPAVPLAQSDSSGRRPRGLLMLILIACMAGVVGGVAGMFIFQNGRVANTSVDAPSQDTPPSVAETEQSASLPPQVEETKTTTAVAQQEPPPADEPMAAKTSADMKQRASQTAQERAPSLAAPSSQTASDASGVDEMHEQAELRGALGEWIEATNARDIRRQMNFYNPRLDAFYRSRNAPAGAVRAEKERVFSRASQIDVQAILPAIRLSPDGRSATMRFRKRYQIAGGGEDRSGEVVQELRWRKTEQGWKIVSERDVRVLN